MLPKEWEAIVDNAMHVFNTSNGCTARDAVEFAIQRCYELHTRPRKQLTRSQIERAFVPPSHTHGISDYEFDSILRVLAAYDALQTEVEEIPFDYEKWKTGEWDAYYAGGKVEYINRASIKDLTMRKVAP